MEDAFEKNNPAAESPSVAPSADLLGALLSNPALIERIGGVLGAMRNGETAASSVHEASENTPTPPGAAPAAAGDGIATLLQNPAMLEKLPQMLAVLKPLMENNAAKPPATEVAVRAVPTPAHHREQLLLSLKPFLSKERCDAVDTILRISQLGDVLGKLK